MAEENEIYSAIRPPAITMTGIGVRPGSNAGNVRGHAFVQRCQFVYGSMPPATQKIL